MHDDNSPIRFSQIAKEWNGKRDGKYANVSVYGIMGKEKGMGQNLESNLWPIHGYI